MRLSEIFAASLVAPLVAAHSNIPGAPKIFGLSQHDFGKLKSRNILGGHNTPHVTRPRQGPQLNARQGGVDGRCGPDHGCASCAESYCCSPSGWCGQGADYCAAPDCLFNYGPACDANKLPTGGSTRNVVRTKLGDQPYGGAGIYSCEKAGTIALTYDDGPYVYTNDLMDMLKAYNAKATFFVTGININKGAIDDASQPWPAVIQRMIAEQHQVASHTWSHQDLSAITKEQRYDQMIRNEMAFTNIIGKFPTYMRPPYSSCTDACQQDLADLGYVVSYFSLDTNDYNNLTPEKIQDSKDIVKNVLDPSNVQTDKFQTIAHDIHELTVHNLTAYMLDEIVKKGYKMVTLGECLGEPEANWYRTPTNRVATTSVFTAPPTCLPIGSVFVTPTLSGPIATPTAVTRDGSCGLASGFTCLGKNPQM
ncbi:glycoside hydrolase/deacetylase [Clathrospora elynae]|uniref:Glycoside hydrolase/deacetylase n=1 Tax=Clathrospora elynae TaxID=706981 RepID=A0A6A5SYT0_9PLEO|nr:glycoside hydrolase/deacetylase [Clathrospora elynae]